MTNKVIESKINIHHCCYLKCDDKAEWIIIHGASSDDYTESCTVHVGDLLTDAYKHEIYHIE